MNGIVSILFTFAQWTRVVGERTVPYIKIGLQAECGACTRVTPLIACLIKASSYRRRQRGPVGRRELRTLLTPHNTDNGGACAD
jgi:hypothetical protein